MTTPEYNNLLIGMGASAGGLRPIVEIIDLLPSEFQGALLVASHRDPNAPSVLGELLQYHTRLRVSEPIDGEALSCTHIYVAGPAEVMTVEGGEVHLGVDRERMRAMKRIDDLFISIAEAAGQNAVGVILSGMLYDGVKGLQAIKQAGGTCIVQSPADAEHGDMPRNALEAVAADYVGTTMDIASRLMELAAGRECGEDEE
ncbi:MAG: chemotaxis protein CheB [Planctomycetota bacterium]|nr:MAG: chemotaxis protein CheB [Planctomycetota bacterium]